MAYPDRIATTGAPIPLTFVKLIDLPAYPEPDTGWLTALFWNGRVSQTSNQPSTLTANKPTLLIDSYQNDGDPGPTGAIVFGVSHADYGIRELGIGVGDNNIQYEEQGYIDEMMVGFARVRSIADTNLFFLRQIVGDLTGGANTPVAIDANPETQTFTWDTTLTGFYCPFMGAALASTVDVPVAMEICNPQYDASDNDLYVGIKIPSTGSLTRVTLFKGDAAANGAQGQTSTIDAQCRDDTYHYFIRSVGSTAVINFTRCTETAYPGAPSYNNYTAKFDDPDLPDNFADLYWETDTDYTFTACYGTDQGFLISYKKLGVPKFILVDREWTTVQHITATAGDATATTILDQGAAGVDDENAISMMMEGGYAWLLGGTTDAPLIVEAVAPDASDDGPSAEDDVTIRCWPFSLDDHDFGVFRLGPSETLVFDLKTRQWAEWRSPDRTNFRAHIGTNWVGMTETLGDFATDVVAGDDVTGVLWILDPTYGEDDRTDTLSDPFPRMVIGAVPLDGRDTAPCGAVQLTASLGAPALTGATVTLRTSDNFGHSYASHGSITVTAGTFDQILEWRALGLMRAPGRIFELSDTGIARIGRLSLR